MGRFFTAEDLPIKRSEYDHNYQSRDWFVGDGLRFVYAFRWFIDDYSFVKTTHPIPRVEIRKWFDECCVGDIFVKDGSYETKTHQARWNTSGNSPTYYVDIRFDTEEDAILFKMTWWEKANGALEEIHETENKS